MKPTATTITTSTAEPAAPAIQATGCCPPFDPAPWDDKELTWRDKRFAKEHVPCLLHVPIGLGRKVTKLMALIDTEHARSEPHPMLSDDTSAWGADLYIPIDKPVPGARMQALSGSFLTKVFEGPYEDAPRWIEDMKLHVRSKGREVDKIFLGYTTCPRCAKAYGTNYVVLFARVKEARPAVGAEARAT